MFAQSKRFSEKQPEPGPAPGDYEVQGSLLVEDPTKKFGFIGQSKRFVPPKLDDLPMIISDTVSDNGSVPSVSSASAKPARVTQMAGYREDGFLKKEVAKLGETLKKEQREYTKSISQMEEKYKNRNSQLHSVLQEKSILLTQTKAKDAEIHKLTGTINHLTSHVTKAETLLDSLSDKLHKSNFTAKKAEDLEKQSTRYKAAYEQAKEKLERALRERDELQDQLESRAHEMTSVEQELKAQVDKLKADRESLAKKLIQERSETEDKMKQIRSETEEQLNELEKSQAGMIKGLENQIDYLEEELRKMSKNNAELRQANFRDRDELTAKIESYQQRIRNMDAQIERLESEQVYVKEDTKIALTRSEHQIKELEDHIGSMERDVATLKEALSESQKRHMSATKEADDAKREVKSTIDQYEKRIREMEQGWKAQLHAKESNLSAVAGSAQQVAAELDELRQSLLDERQKFESEKATLQGMIADLKQASAKLARELKLSREEAESDRAVQVEELRIKDDTISRVSAEIAKLETQLALKQREFQSFREQWTAQTALSEEMLKKLRAQNEEMDAELRAARDDALSAQTQLRERERRMDADFHERDLMIRRLDGQNGDLKLQIASKDADLERLEKEMSAIQATLVEKEAIVHDLKEQGSRAVAEREQTIQSLKNELAVKDAKIAAANAQKDQRLGEVQEANSMLLSQIAEHEGTISQLNAEAEELSSQIRAVAETAEELRKALADSQSELADKAADLERLSAEMGTLTQTYEGKLEESMREMSALKHDFAALSDELASSKAQIEALQEAKANAEETIVKMQAEHDGIRASWEEEKGELKEDLERTNADLEEADRDRENLKAELEDTKADLEDSRKDVRALKEEVETIEARNVTKIEELTEQVQQLEHVLAEHKGLNQELLDKLSEAESTLEQVRNESNKAEEEASNKIEKLAKKLSDLKEQVDEQKEATEELQEKLRESSNEVDQLTDSLAEEKDRNRALADKVDELEAKTGQMKEEHDEAMKTLKRVALEREEQLTAQRDELKEVISELDGRLKWMEEQAELHEEQVLELHEQLVEARRTYRHFTAMKEMVKISENIAESDWNIRCEMEDMQKVLMAELQAATSLLDQTMEMLADAQEEAFMWREECAMLEEGRELTRELASDVVVAAIEAVGADRDAILEETEDRLETVLVAASGTIAQITAEREIALAQAAADSAQVEAYRASFDEQVERVAAEAEDLRSRLKEAETRIAHERKMYEQEAAKCRLAIQSLDEQKRSQAAEMRKHQEAVRFLEDAVKKERQRSAGLEDELRRSGKYREENLRLQMEIEQGRAVVAEAERKLSAVEATQNLAEQLEQENGDLHNEIVALNGVIRELEESRMTEEEDLLGRVEVMMKQQSMTETEMEKISEINSALMGHQNIRQKIKYVDNIKRENMKLKKDHVELTATNQKQRITILKLQRDLEALKSTSDTFHKSRSRSRVGRAALSQRQGGMDSSFASASFANSLVDADGKENDRWSEE